ncbi:hypothetical protein ABZP36_022603 [Zizania latifolia]
MSCSGDRLGDSAGGPPVELPPPPPPKSTNPSSSLARLNTFSPSASSRGKAPQLHGQAVPDPVPDEIPCPNLAPGASSSGLQLINRHSARLASSEVKPADSKSEQAAANGSSGRSFPTTSDAHQDGEAIPRCRPPRKTLPEERDICGCGGT